MLASVIAALLTLACGGPSRPAVAPDPETPPAAGGAGDSPGSPAASPPARSSSPPGAPPASCDYRVGETCYASEAEACSAAGCKPGECIVLESYPAQIHCK